MNPIVEAEKLRRRHHWEWEQEERRKHELNKLYRIEQYEQARATKMKNGGRNPANSSTASAPRRTDHRRPTASSPGREPARFQSSSSSICRRFQDIPLGNHGSRARSRSRGPRSHERDDHRRVHQRSRSASRHLRADTSESRRTHRSRSLSRSRTRQHYRSGARRRSSKSPGQPRHRSIRSRSRSPPKRSSREEMIRRGANVFGPQIPYGFIMLPPGMFPMGPFPGGVVNPLPRFPFPPPPPPPPRHPAFRFNAGNPYYRAPYR